MERAGVEAVERAKENGRWDAEYDRFGAAQIPEDLAAQLQQRPRAKAFFQTLSGQNRYAILFRLQTAKKLETRAKRLEKFVGMLENQQTIYPQSLKSGRREKS